MRRSSVYGKGEREPETSLAGPTGYAGYAGYAGEYYLNIGLVLDTNSGTASHGPSNQLIEVFDAQPGCWTISEKKIGCRIGQADSDSASCRIPIKFAGPV